MPVRSGFPAVVLTGLLCCFHSTLAAQSETPEKNSALSLLGGIEISSASGFDRAKASPAFGATLTLPGLWHRGKVSFALDASAEFTQAAVVRNFASCRHIPVIIGPDTLRGGPRHGPSCAAADTVVDTTFITALATDSVAFRTVGVWRGFLRGLVESELGSTGVRLGVAGLLGFQTNPLGTSNPQQQRIRTITLVGPSLRWFTENREAFGLQVVYGTVQNYAEEDQLAGGIGTKTRVAALPIQDAKQWQLRFILWPYGDVYLRGFVTLNAPPPNRLGVLPAPDLARIAILIQKDPVTLFTDLIGGKSAAEKNTPGTQERSAAPN